MKDVVRDLGPSINLLERMSSGQASERAINGLLDHLPEFARVAKHMGTPRQCTMESILNFPEVRSFLRDRLKVVAEEAEAMLFASRLKAIREFNRQMWGSVLKREVDFVPELPAVDPALLEYLQRQFQFAVVYLPGNSVYDMGLEAVRALPGRLECLNGYPKEKGEFFRAEPQVTPSGWYAVEKTSPCHFGHSDRDYVARFMKYDTRDAADSRELTAVYIPAMERFLGIPDGSIMVPSAEELNLFRRIARHSEVIPNRGALTMFSECSCDYWGDTGHPEICRNRVLEYDDHNTEGRSSPYAMVLGGTPRYHSHGPSKSGERWKYFCADLALTPKNVFRVMVSLDKCVGAEFDTVSHPPFYSTE